MATRSFLRGLALGLVALLGGGACAESSGPPALAVFAASSAQDVLGDLIAAYQQHHPGELIHAQYAGSQILRVQVEHGATPDVFISANLAHLEALTSQGLMQPPQVVATTPLALIVPPHNPAHLSSFSDLPKARRIVLGTADVPAGAYARAWLQKVGPDFSQRVMSRVVSEESNVRLVRSKVALGEADAALVYRTDVDHSVKAVSLEGAPVVEARLVAAVGSRTVDAGRAAAFVSFLRGDEAAPIWSAHGFSRP